MRRALCVSAVALLCLAALGAYDNHQEIFPAGSEVFEAITELYVIDGRALPSSTGPWSAAELLGMMAKLDREALGDQARAIYDHAMGILGKPPKNTATRNLGMSFGLRACPEFYWHSNTGEAFQGRERWNRGLMEQEPFLNISWKTWPGRNLYGYFELPMMNNFNLKERFGSTAFGCNLPMMASFKFTMTDFDWNIPYRAFVAVGGGNWSLQAGRDRLSWGAGETGNLVISDNIPCHNIVRFATFFDSYKYTFLTSFFPHPLNYASENEALWGHGKGDTQDKGLSFYMAHRIEGRLLRDRLSLTLTEAIMYMSADGNVDPRVLNPMAIFHNYYIRGNANSTLALEADVCLCRGLDLYGQVLLDEFHLPNEPAGPDAPWAFPDAFGFLGGLKGFFPLGPGVLRISVETAKTDPFLYLRDGGTGDDDATYGLQYVVALRTFTNNTGIVYDEFFLGYEHGGDALVGNLNLGWKLPGRLSVEGNLFLMRHGTYDKWTCWNKVGTRPGCVPWDESQTPTTTHANTGNRKDPAAKTTRNSASDTLVAGLNVNAAIVRGLSAFLQADYIAIDNFGNIAGRKENDFQLAFGLKYEL